MKDSGFRISWFFVFSVLFVATPSAGLGPRDRKEHRESGRSSSFPFADSAFIRGEGSFFWTGLPYGWSGVGRMLAVFM